jgi:hypothetical protein
VGEPDEKGKDEDKEAHGYEFVSVATHCR